MSTHHRITDPFELDHVMEICRVRLEDAISLAPRLADDDPAAVTAHERVIIEAKSLEQILKEDAEQDCNAPSWLDLNDPTDQLLIQQQGGNTLERAARYAYQQTSEWRACVEACGTDGLWESFQTFEKAWTRLLMMRLYTHKENTDGKKERLTIPPHRRAWSAICRIWTARA